jgi:hypothetical protein
MGQHSAIFIKINGVLSCVFDWEVCIVVSFLVYLIEKYVYLCPFLCIWLRSMYICGVKIWFYFSSFFFSGKNLCYDNEYLDIDLIAEYLQNDKT